MFNKKALLAPIVTLTILLGSMNDCEGTSPGWLPYLNFCEPCWDADVSVYTGYVTRSSQELAFNVGHDPQFPYKISQLDWKIRDLWVMGVTAEFNFWDDSIHLSFDGWNKIHAAHSTMVDKDFFDPDEPSHVTDISWHPDTHLKAAYELEGELGYDFFCFQRYCSQIKLGVMLGYKYFRLHWKAYGGRFSYNNGQFNGEFPPGKLVIGFAEEFSIPYVGLQADWQWNDRLDILVFGKYTCVAYVKNSDFHALRHIRFVDRFCNANYWVAGVEARWNIWRWIDLDLRYNYEHLNTATGDTKVKFNDEEETIPKAAGVKHCHQLIAIGLTASF